MSTTATMAKTGKATTVRKTFSRTTSVSTEINADPAIIWSLLTKASDASRWNSTVLSIEGNIALGETIILKSPLSPERKFKLKVKEFEKEKKLVWGDGMGTRIFTLTKNSNGTTTFKMTEKIEGPVFPLFAKMIPSFDESFDRFASDLKKEAETIMNSK
ncbi:MAG: SRPBCC family protein [Bacteroidetes bacterium]|nr:SRPBCC family protein [Bacteroidota bacterium]